ncbi:MAG: hypothetical protein KA383_18840 [Phycisphaerae bacterium]|nr:hypothetical protein [Phycisphaerae bacterium]
MDCIVKISPHTRAGLASVAGAFFARPATTGVRVAVLQLLFIVTWHALMLGGLALVALEELGWLDSWLYRGVPRLDEITIPFLDVRLASSFTFLFSAQFAAIEAVLVWGVYWVFVPRRLRTFFGFVRAWWRNCLWGTLAVPFVPVVVEVLPESARGWALCIVPVAYLVVGPGWWARRELGLRFGRSRWRPECPECGYSLRRLTTDRCPECGNQLPTPVPTYRRWARRRLRWDRRDRGNLAVAYVKTVLAIVCCPCRAARGTIIPDRFPRAIRWALVHVALYALLHAALSPDVIQSAAVQAVLFPSMPAWVRVEAAQNTPAARILLWSAQSFTAWLIALATFPALGSTLGALVPGRHPAARRGIIKWSLYGSVLVPVVGLLGTAVHWSRFVWNEWPISGPTWVFACQALTSAPAVPLAVLAITYALWWAAGVAVNPYLLQRGRAAFMLNAVVFLVACYLLGRVAFPHTMVELL